MSTDSSSGHYTCGSNGEKRCRAGWSNPSGNCLTRMFWCLENQNMARYVLGGYLTVAVSQLC